MKELQNDLNTSEIESLEIFEDINDVEELEQRYEYDTSVTICKYTIHF